MTDQPINVSASVAMNDEDNYYTLVGEQGLCLVDDAVINLKTVSLIRKQDGKTLVYRPGVPEPVALPPEAFDVIRDAVFAIDDYEDDDEEEEDE